jgi:hypothetical protein
MSKPESTRERTEDVRARYEEGVDRAVPRRRFLIYGAGSLVLAGLGGVMVRSVRQSNRVRRENPFALDLSPHFKLDPALVRYERVARFSCSEPDARRLAIDGEGRLHVAAGRHVVTLSSDGALLDDLAFDEPVRCVAVAGDGIRYVGFADHVEVFRAGEQRVGTWERIEGRPFLSGLAVDVTTLYAADSGNRLIWKYDRSGRLLGQIGERDAGRNVAGLVVPSPWLDVAIGPDGLLRVNNPGRHRVEVYTVTGDLEFYWGRAAVSVDGFCGCCNPVGLDVLPDGRTVTFEKGLPRVKVFGASGEFESVVAGPEAFADVSGEGVGGSPDPASIGGLDGAVDAAGRIHVVNRSRGDVHVFESRDVLRSGAAAT